MKNAELKEFEQHAASLMTHATHPHLMKMMHRGWQLRLRYSPDIRMYVAFVAGGTTASDEVRGGSPLEAVEKLDKLCGELLEVGL